MESPLVHGKIVGAFVSDVLRLLVEDAPPDCAFIVRCIDSARSPEDLTKALSFHRVRHHRLHGNVVLFSEDLANALRADVFTGFDEVWAYLGRPPAEDLTELPSATSETTDFTRSLSTTLVEAIHRTGCELVIGDGSGLNYAALRGRMGAKVIKELSL